MRKKVSDVKSYKGYVDSIQRGEKTRKRNRQNQRFMFFVGVFLVFSLSVLFALASGNTETEEIDKHLQKLLNNYDLVEIYARPGDTAWTIQKKLVGEDANLAEMIHYLGELNDRDSIGDIKAGEKITFFVEK